jgi:hypothetical protein
LRELVDLGSRSLCLRSEQRLHFLTNRLILRARYVPSSERNEDAEPTEDGDDCGCDPSNHALLLYREWGEAQAI